MNEKRGTVLFIPHGGGPLPILGDPHHKKLVKFIENINLKLINLLQLLLYRLTGKKMK